MYQIYKYLKVHPLFYYYTHILFVLEAALALDGKTTKGLEEIYVVAPNLRLFIMCLIKKKKKAKKKERIMM